MDPWGFRAEERQGHNRFLASPTINLNKPPGRTFDQEDEEYLQSYPTILHIDSTDSSVNFTSCIKIFFIFHQQKIYYCCVHEQFL